MNTQSEHQHGNQATARTKLVVFGEVLFDCFPDGRRVLGGASFNVAWALKGFGLDPVLITAVGTDPDGDEILARMRAWDMRSDGVQSHTSVETGVVQVTLTDGDASYEIPAPRAWDEIADMNFAADSMLYHGSLALRSEMNRATLSQIIKRSGGKRFYDVNLRPPHTPLDRVKEWLTGAAWVKCNLEELQLILGLSSLTFGACEKAAQQLRSAYSVEHVLVTAGGDGARVIGPSGVVLMPPPPMTDKIVDTVGAGDSFSAVVIEGALTGRSVQDTLLFAGKFARKVCMMRGATVDDRAFYDVSRR